MMTWMPTFTWKRTAAVACLLVVSSGCSFLFPNGGPFQPSPTADLSTPAPTAFSAQTFLHSTGPDASQYPAHYFSPGGEISILVPGDWPFDQGTDSGQELNSLSESAGGAPVAAMYTLPDLDRDTTASQSMEAFMNLEWVAGRKVEITEQKEFGTSAGYSGWMVNGTMLNPAAPETREGCVFVAFVKNSIAFVLAAYPNRSADPESFRTAWEGMAQSFQWEETRTRDVDKENALQLAETEPATLDPALTLEGPGGAVGDIYSGLVSLDRSLTVKPELAESWDVTPDGKTYTFHLRENARFHNDRPVTADDVLYSWLRAASPEINSSTAVRYLGDIVGLREFREGKADSISGIRVVDPRTIQVTIDSAKPYFPEKLTYPTSWIVDRYTVQIPNWQYHPIGTGPFRVVQHLPGKSLLLEADQNFYKTPPQIQYLVYLFSSSSQESLYKSGKSDKLIVPTSMLANVNDPHDPYFGTVSLQQKLCTNFIQFNQTVAPFEDPAVRKAFALSINREVYTEVTPEEGDLPAGGILPPGMPGYSPEQSSDAYNPRAAKDLITQTHFFDEAQTAPGIRYPVSSESGEYNPTAEFLVDAWETTLGIDILVEGYPYDTYQARQKEKSSDQLVHAQHCADYPDPENFYDFLFYGGNADIYYGYQNSNLDTLLKSAAIETDWSLRVDLYRQADKILFDDAPVIVLSYSGPQYVVWKPHVMGFIPTVIEIPQHQLMWIQRN